MCLSVSTRVMARTRILCLCACSLVSHNTWHGTNTGVYGPCVLQLASTHGLTQTRILCPCVQQSVHVSLHEHRYIFHVLVSQSTCCGTNTGILSMCSSISSHGTTQHAYAVHVFASPTAYVAWHEYGYRLHLSVSPYTLRGMYTRVLSMLCQSAHVLDENTDTESMSHHVFAKRHRRVQVRVHKSELYALTSSSSLMARMQRNWNFLLCRQSRDDFFERCGLASHGLREGWLKTGEEGLSLTTVWPWSKTCCMIIHVSGEDFIHPVSFSVLSVIFYCFCPPTPFFFFKDYYFIFFKIWCW